VNTFLKIMNLDIYTNTVKEILTSLERMIDNVIDQTSPDLKSNFSCQT